MAVLVFAISGAAWADHHRTPPGPPLRISDVSPDGGTTGVSTAANHIITIYFDKEMNTDTLFFEGNIKLKKLGARRAVSFFVQGYNHVEDKYEAQTAGPLKPNTTYKVIVDGGLDGVRSADGGKLGGVDDASATFKKGNVVWTFKTAP